MESTLPTAYARHLFLYGTPDEGKPILSVTRLCKLSGCTPATISNHRRRWEKEREEILQNASPSGIAMRVTAEKEEKNNDDIEFIRYRMDKVKAQIMELPDCLKELQNFLNNFTEGADEVERNNALGAFRLYLQGIGKAATLDSHFLTLQKRWSEISGVGDVQSIDVTRAKAMAVEAGKLQAEQQAAESRKRPTAARQVTGFARSTP